MADYFWAIFYGIIEGLTEFLPVSSTGHLILAEKLSGQTFPAVFHTLIQLGAILAIVFLYFQKLWGVLLDLPKDKAAQKFAINLIFAFFPAMIIGASLEHFIKTQLFNEIVVAYALIIGGIAIILIEKIQHQPKFAEVDDIDLKTAIKIGFCQCLAMIPGTSRSGASILGGMMMGLSRKAAAEFSFFLAIPTMLGVFIYDFYKHRSEIFAQGGQEFTLIAIGFVVSFFVALAVVKAFMALISKTGFTPFGIYRILVGAIILAVNF